MAAKSDPNGRPDRRIQRTIRLLREALMELVIEKGYDAVTIQDITDRADVARTTFYLHFRDKDELLFTGMQAMYDELLAAGPELSRDDLLAGELSAAMMDARDFEHAAQYAEFYRAILGKRGSTAFMVQLRTYMADMLRREALNKLVAPGQEPRLPLDFLAHFMAGA